MFTLIRGDLSLFTPFRIVNVDLILVFSAFLSVFYGEIRAGLFAYTQGLLMDILSGGVLGLHALIYLLVFTGLKLGARLFDLQSAHGQFIVVTLAVLVKGMISVAFLYAFSLKVVFSSSQILTMLTSAGCSGLAAYMISFALFHFREGLLLDYGEDRL
jgi:rod shape-determining protein MreD